jgi:hypothetical protein
MRHSLALHRRLDSASTHSNECSAEQSANITRRMHVSAMTVFCILVTLAVIVYWLFLAMAMPETQLEPAIFLDR